MSQQAFSEIPAPEPDEPTSPQRVPLRELEDGQRVERRLRGPRA